MIFQIRYTTVHKGDLINIDLNNDGITEQYRVLNVADGHIVEIVSMEHLTTSKFGSTQIYEGSVLDGYLNETWYNTLSQQAKVAIIDKTFQQQSWNLNTLSGTAYDISGKSGAKNPGTTAYSMELADAGFGEKITRHAYALGIQDVLNYVRDTEITDGELQNYNVWQMFWSQSAAVSKYFWLRDASASNVTNVFRVNGGRGYTDRKKCSDSYAIRPALTIDLSKMRWTKEE